MRGWRGWRPGHRYSGYQRKNTEYDLRSQRSGRGAGARGGGDLGGDGQRLGVKDGPFGLIGHRPLKAGVALSFDTPDDQHGTVLLTREMAAAFGRWLIRQAGE